MSEKYGHNKIAEIIEEKYLTDREAEEPESPSPKGLQKDSLEKKLMTPQSFGAFLRMEREERFVTCKDIASATRIRENFVEALENGDFASLPARPFARGFVSSISNFMKLDTKDVLMRFDVAADIFWGEQRPVVGQARKKKIPWFYILMFSVVLTVICLIVFFMLKSFRASEDVRKVDSVSVEMHESIKETHKKVDPTASDEEKLGKSVEKKNIKRENTGKTVDISPKIRAKKKDTKHANVSKTKDKKTSSSPKKNTRKKSIKPVKTESRTAFASSAPVGEKNAKKLLYLSIKAREVSWLNVVVDSDKVHDMILKAGEKVSWQASVGFKITIGNAGGVDVFFNGKKMGPYGKPGQVRRIYLSKKDLKD